MSIQFVMFGKTNDNFISNFLNSVHTLFSTFFPVLKNFCIKNSFSDCKFYKQLLSLLRLVKEFLAKSLHKTVDWSKINV